MRDKKENAILQIIGGMLKGEKILIPVSKEVRPTRAVVREAVFQIWAEMIVGAMFLDPFAGSGAMALEALSRGAEEIYASDIKPEILFNLRKKLRDLEKKHHQSIGFQRMIISAMDFQEALSEYFIKGKKFDLVYLDPPYNSGMGIEAMKLIERYMLLNPDGRIMLEISKREKFNVDDFVEESTYLLLKKYVHGDTVLLHFALDVSDD